MTLAIVFDSVGFGEWFLLLAVVLIVVGPKRLPSTARKIGSYYSKFRRAAESFKRQLMEMDSELERSVKEAVGTDEDPFKTDGDDASSGTPAGEDDVYSPPGYDPDADYGYYDESGDAAEEEGIDGGEPAAPEQEGVGDVAASADAAGAADEVKDTEKKV